MNYTPYLLMTPLVWGLISANLFYNPDSDDEHEAYKSIFVGFIATMFLWGLLLLATGGK